MMGNDIKPPCRKDCPYRDSTCHTTCLSYLDYVQRKEVYKNYINEEKLAKAGYNQYRYKETTKHRHRRNRSGKR